MKRLERQLSSSEAFPIKDGAVTEKIRKVTRSVSEKLGAVLPTMESIQRWADEVKGSKFDKGTAIDEFNALRLWMDLIECVFEIHGYQVRVRAVKKSNSQFASVQFWRMEEGVQIFEHISTEFPEVKVVKIQKD